MSYLNNCNFINDVGGERNLGKRETRHEEEDTSPQSLVPNVLDPFKIKLFGGLCYNIFPSQGAFKWVH